MSSSTLKQVTKRQGRVPQDPQQPPPPLSGLLWDAYRGGVDPIESAGDIKLASDQGIADVVWRLGTTRQQSLNNEFLVIGQCTHEMPFPQAVLMNSCALWLCLCEASTHMGTPAVAWCDS